MKELTRDKLKGIPSIFCVSLEESEDRRKNLLRWFTKYNITNYNICQFKRFHEYKYNLMGALVDTLHEGSKGPITSHLTLLKLWYDTTSEPYVLVIEDDLSLETVEYWNFTWSDFFNNLPSNWNCVQLVLIRDHFCEQYFFEERKENDWCAAAYLVKREYVKFLLDSHYSSENTFSLDIQNLYYPPVVEHILFSKKPGVYCFPLFVEDCKKTSSTTKDVLLIENQGEYHISSYENCMHWWKNVGKNLSIDQIMMNKKNEESFTLSNLIKKYNLNVKGIIHVGAHYGEEIPSYIEQGIKNIVLFEPLKENFKILQERMNQLPANFSFHNVALGSFTNKTKMYVSDNEGQSSSILKPSIHLSHHPNVYFPETEEVEVNILDDYSYNDYNCLVMDVQGYELEVLKGAKETLKNIDYVYCEVNRAEVYEKNAYVEEIDEFLKQYDMERVETYWMGDIWGDALYIKSKVSAYHISPTCQIPNLSNIYEKYFGKNYDGFFVEIGAYDGETFSNTSGLADKNWKGIYIEPVLEYFNICKSRHFKNNVKVLNLAVGSEEKEITTFVSGGLSTTNKEMLKIYSEIEWSKDYIFLEQKSYQKRLENILKENLVPINFDLLVIDVEGNEKDVFDSFDLLYWNPKMIIIELIDAHESFQKFSEHVKTNLDLRKNIIFSGYEEIYKDHINTVFIKKECI